MKHSWGSGSPFCILRSIRYAGFKLDEAASSGSPALFVVLLNELKSPSGPLNFLSESLKIHIFFYGVKLKGDAI